MPVNPKLDRKPAWRLIAAIPVMTLAAMAIGAIVFPIVTAIAALS